MSVVEFGGLELATSPGQVMTPRLTSLALVERAVAHIGDEPLVVVDVGTGSGAIAIAIAEAAARAHVWATDVSEEAVELARCNAWRCGVGDRVHVRRGHLLEPVEGDVDVIVANLPYMAWHERGLHPELATEPPDAVFAPGDGLGPYRCLMSAAASRLSPQGLIAVQLRGRVLAASASEIEELSEALVHQAA